MAWAEKLQSGKWRGCWRHPDGTKASTNKTTHPEHPYAKKRDALEAAQEAEVSARRGAAVANRSAGAGMTWAEWWDHAKPERGDSDTDHNESYLVANYLLPRWGGEPMNKIGQRDVKAWLADLTPGRQPSYVRRIYGVFRHSMNQAVDEGLLTASPCVNIRLPKVAKRAKLYADEQRIEEIRPHLGKHWRDVVDLGMETGLRPGELCGLHASGVDLETGWLTVSSVLVARRKVIRGHPKDKDVRTVPLTLKALSLIEELLAGRDLKAGCGVPHVDGRPCRSVLVLQLPTGGVLTPVAWYRGLERAAGKAGVSGLTPYSVRRGFATRAARGGIDPFELAEIMGHADVRQTQEYVQQTPAARDRLRVALGESPRLTVVQGGGAVGNDSTIPIELGRTVRHS